MRTRLLGALCALFTTTALHAQTSFPGSYTQNFDIMGTAGTTMPSGWSVYGAFTGSGTTWSTTIPASGVVGGTQTTTVTAATTYTATSNTSGYNYATTGNTVDRALGASPTTGPGVALQLSLTNSTGAAVSAIQVRFDTRRFNTATANELPGYWPFYSLDNGTTWTNISTLNATSTTVPNSTGISIGSAASVTLTSTWANNSVLLIRWMDDNANQTSPDQVFGLDNVSVATVPADSTKTSLLLNGSTIVTSSATAGNGSYVTMGSAAALGASSFTLECKIYKTGTGTTASTGTGGVVATPIFAKGRSENDGSNVDCNYFLGIDSTTGKLCADFEQLNATNNGTAYAAGQNFPILGSTVLANNTWYHVAATYDTTTAVWKLYVDGVEETTSVPTGSPATFVGVTPRNDSIQHFAIGTALNSTGIAIGFFQGVIDEVRVWNVARLGTDIANNKNAEIGTTTTGLLARYGLNEGTGTTANNSVGTGGAPLGTLTNAPVWANTAPFVVNALPTVALTAPANNASFMAPATVSITATASDSDGTITKVEFYEGANKIGEDTTSPYQYDWSRSNAQTGTYSLTAKTTDNLGGVATSGAVSITITQSANQPPVVTLSSPANNATGIGASTTISAALSDNESDAMTVTFYGRQTVPATAGADFTIATLPDTQFYSENLNNNNRAATYYAQTQWLVDNRDNLNLAFVSHMGDLVQNGDAVPAEWLVADAAMKKIENQSFTLRAHGIPWGGAPGNHDQTVNGSAGGANAYYNQYFGESRFLGRSYWGGSQSVTNNHNNYQLFSASGLDFIIIHMEYDVRSKSSYQAVLDWADALMKAYPNRRAIVTSHWVVNTGSPATFSTQGQNIYDDLKDNPNFFLMLCGHVAGEGQRSDVFQGRTVYSVLQDYQGRTNGGDGWLRYFIFSPANNTISARTYRVSNPVNAVAGSFETDADSQFTLNYNMQGAVTDWIPLGTVNVAAGGTTASLNWTGLTAGKDFEWYATANDGTSTASSSTRRFSTTANAAPTITLDTPANNSTATAPANFTLSATASDSDGSITRVEFYQGGTKLGTDTTAPYTQSVSGLLVGSYAFSAVAVDNTGASTLSSVANVTVNASLPPTVAITSPAANATFDALAAISITADAADADGTVALVEFFNGATKLGEDSTAPYTFNWTGVISSSTGYSLTAKATDNASTTATSAVVNITVTNTDNSAPTVAITAPTNNSSFAPGVPLTLTATASDTDGVISKVEFFDGATLLGEDTTAPYSFAITALASGAHTFTAKATDNDNGTTVSSVINVNGDPALWAYAQNFDSMASGTAPPSGWSFYGVFGGANSTYTDSIPIPASAASGGTLNNTLIASTTIPATTASSNTQGYNFALAASSSDRALGTSPTTGQFIALQLSVSNTSGAAINAVRLGYDIRRFTSVATANELPGYFVFYSLDNGTTWNAAASLNPSITSVPNTVGVTTMGPTTITLPSAWASGATLLIRWIDDNAVATSPDQICGLDNVSITLPVGQPPTVALTAPASGFISYVGDTITLTATAADSDGTITKVEFYQGSTKLGEDTTTPYAYDWTGFTAGAYSLTARAIDNDGNITSSNATSITVNATPGSGTLTRSPYLNQGNQNSIVIRWRTSQAVVGRVRYGTTSGSLTQTKDESAAQTDHEVKLTGLTPYTRYYYSVGSSFDTLTPETADTTSVTTGTYTIPTPTAADYTFRTSPTPGTATNTRIWVVGDCGRGSASQAGGRDAYYNWMGSRVPDLNLQLGDNAYNSGTDAEYQSGYYLMYPTIFRKMPQWSTLGNHDANNGTTTPTTNFPYFDMFTFPTAAECGGTASGTEHYYSFDYGNIHFICLDSQTTLANSSPTAPQSVWLQNDLASTTATWIIAFFHHPPYSKGSHDSDSEAQMVTMRQVYLPILEAGGVDLVLTGHSHNYERSVLLDGHYGITSTITSSMKKNAGNGSTTGFTTSASGVIRNAANSYTATATVNGTVIPADGAYIKPLLGVRNNFGAVYNTAGMSGQADGGSLNHTAMYISYNSVGTVNLDINDNTLTATFVQSGGAAPDNYTIIKQGGSTPPLATTSAATNIGATSVTLNGSVNPTGTHSTAKFQIGTDTNYGANATVTLSPDDDVVSQTVNTTITGLTPGTTYHFRVSATNSNGTTNGGDLTFTTLQNNANLASLTVGSGSLAPAFAAGTTAYTVAVPNATTSITVTPTVADANATVQVRVNGGTYAAVTSGSASAALALNVNDNPVQVKVTAQDGTIKTYTVAVTRATLFAEWTPLQSVAPALAAPTADADGDGVSNIVEYAFGLNPTASDSTPLTVTTDGNITTRGNPVTTVASTPTAVDFRAAHVRRKDATAAGLTYTVQFSAGDGSWTSSTATPTVVASDSEVEVVTVKYPLFLNGKKARFFRVVVTAP